MTSLIVTYTLVVFLKSGAAGGVATIFYESRQKCEAAAKAAHAESKHLVEAFCIPRN